jgi:hypothetical protein
MQLEPFGARQQVRLAPPFGGAVTAAGKQPVEHRQAEGPFDVKFEAPALEQAAGCRSLATTARRPSRARFCARHRLGLTGRVGVQHRQALALAHPRAHEPIQLAALLQEVEAAQGRNDLLADLFAFADAMRNLQVDVLSFTSRILREVVGIAVEC